MKLNWYQMEKEWLENLTAECKHNLSLASRVSGQSRSGLLIKLKRYRLLDWHRTRRRALYPKKIKLIPQKTGRPQKVNYSLALKMANEGYSKAEVAQHFKCALKTIEKVFR